MARPPADTVQVTVTLPRSLLEFIDTHATRLAAARAGAPVSRADVMREMLGQAREAIEATLVRGVP